MKANHNGMQEVGDRLLLLLMSKIHQYESKTVRRHATGSITPSAVSHYCFDANIVTSTGNAEYFVK